MEAYSTLIKNRKEESDKYKDLMKPIEKFNLRYSELDMAYINTDSSRIARNDRWKENLQKDVYLEEALYVLADLKANRNP